MKIRKKLIFATMLAVLMGSRVSAAGEIDVSASDGEEYITITVQAEDDSSDITYSLDSDSPDNFGTSNTFRIPAGTSHTIYVKDAAGNISSQVYEPERLQDESGRNTDDTDTVEEDGSEDQTINIDLEIGKTGETGTDTYAKNPGTPAEQGEGTVYSKTYLDGTDNSEQVFYSVTTDDGNVYYLLIDQGQSENNVYLLNQVTDSELYALAADDGTETPKKESSGSDDSLLKILSSQDESDGTTDDGSKTTKKTSSKNAIIVVIIIAIGGGVYYYMKIYRDKKDKEMDIVDAADMDQFETDEAQEEEEFDFDFDDEEKEEYLMRIVNDAEDEIGESVRDEMEENGWKDADADEENGEGDEFYATSHKNDVMPEPGYGGEDIFSDEEPETGNDDNYDPELDGEEET
jgi:hypothetical protein